MTNGYSSVVVEFALGEAPLTVPHTYGHATTAWQTISTVRGKQPNTAQHEMGTATIVVNNTDDWFNPDNAAGLIQYGRFPMCPIRISALDSTATRRNMWTGFVQPLNGWIVNYSAQGRVSSVTINCVDLFTVLNTLDLPPIDPLLQPQLYAGLHSGEQLASLIIDGVLPISNALWTGATPGNSALGTNVPEGQALVQPYRGGMNALAWVQQMALSEGGAFYIDRDGLAHFDDRYATISVANMLTSQATFDSTPGQVAYRDLTKDYASVIYNSVTVTPNNQPPITKADATSITNYTQFDLALTGTFLNDTAEGAARAAWYLAAYKDPIASPSALTIDPRRANNSLDCALKRELRDRVTVKFKPPGQTTQDVTDVDIVRINHELNAAQMAWHTTFALEPRRYGFTTFADYLQYDQSEPWDGTRKWGF